MNYNLQGKTACITGASRGLGRCIAEHYWRAGANLILIARSEDKLNVLRERLLTKNYVNEQFIRLYVLDLMQPDAILFFSQEIVLKNKIDILINNAAIQGPIGPSWENDWNAWQATLQMNLLTPIAFCCAVIPQMKQFCSGKIINLSGGGATQARPYFSSYAVSKTGLVRFSETLAEEVKEYNIAVNCIAPGVMNTDMLEKMLQEGKSFIDKEEYEKIKTMSMEKDAIERVAKLSTFLGACDNVTISGKLISARWDPWEKLPHYLSEIANPDVYTLRRVVPAK